MYVYMYIWGFPGGSDSKESACNSGDPASIPGLGRSPEEGNGYPLHYSCLESPMDRGIWWLQLIESQRVRHDWVTNSHFFFFSGSYLSDTLRLNQLFVLLLKLLQHWLDSSFSWPLWNILFIVWASCWCFCLFLYLFSSTPVLSGMIRFLRKK